MINALLRVGDKISGFQVKSVDPLPEINSTLIQLTHQATGARWAHLASEDRENLFAVAFRTPPRQIRPVSLTFSSTLYSVAQTDFRSVTHFFRCSNGASARL